MNELCDPLRLNLQFDVATTPHFCRWIYRIRYLQIFSIDFHLFPLNQATTLKLVSVNRLGSGACLTIHDRLIKELWNPRTPMWDAHECTIGFRHVIGCDTWTSVMKLCVACAKQGCQLHNLPNLVQL